MDCQVDLLIMWGRGGHLTLPHNQPVQPSVIFSPFEAMQHLGSLIFASLLMALFRPIRWVVNAFLMAEEAASMTEVAQCIIAGARA